MPAGLATMTNRAFGGRGGGGDIDGIDRLAVAAHNGVNSADYVTASVRCARCACIRCLSLMCSENGPLGSSYPDDKQDGRAGRGGQRG